MARKSTVQLSTVWPYNLSELFKTGLVVKEGCEKKCVVIHPSLCTRSGTGTMSAMSAYRCRVFTAEGAVGTSGGSVLHVF